MDVARTQYDGCLVVCGVSGLLKRVRTIEFLNQNRVAAPKINAIKPRTIECLFSALLA